MEMGRSETQEKTPPSEPLVGKMDWTQRGYRVHQVAAFVLHIVYIMKGEEVPFHTRGRCCKSWEVCCGHLCEVAWK